VIRWLAGRAARLAARVAGVLALAGILVAAAPVTVVAGVSAWVAWLRGLPPARLYQEAAWLVPMVAAWLAAIAIVTGSWQRAAAAPYQVWAAMWHLAAAGSYPSAAVMIAPIALPLGIAAGGMAWSYRLRSMASAAGGASAGSAVSFDLRQWRHQVRSAAARIAAPGAVPLTTAAGDVVVGAVIRAVGHPATGLARLRYERLRSHQVVIGGTGTGKTTLLLRLWAAFMATAMRRYAAGQGRAPLLVVLDCKGGGDARKIADRARRVLRAAGARTTAIWPDEASLSIWVLPPRQLITTLVDLVEHGTGGAAYYADILDAVVALAVSAPCGPPTGRLDFLARLDAGWLTMAYQSGGDGAELELIRSAARQIADVALRYRTLLRRLGTGLDGSGQLADADAWYCILEGTAEVSVAEAQARALIDLLASQVASGRGAREVLLAVDEFSAVSRRLPIWNLYERARSLGLAVQVSAQSWHGLAPDDTDRYRIVSAAEGGIWLLRTPHPEPVTELVGQRRAVDTTRRLIGYPRWSRTGSAKVREIPVADPALVRRLDVGQAAYLYRGGVTFVQVSRLVGTPAALGPALAPGPVGAERRPPATALAGTTLPAGPAEWRGLAERPAMARRPATAGQRAVAGETAVAEQPGRAEQAGRAERPRMGGLPSMAELADITLLLDAAFGPEPTARRNSRRTTPGVAGLGPGVLGQEAGVLGQEAGSPAERAAATGQAAPAGDPFRALGLPADPELTDDDIRVAWRRIAAATHPDRADGGDPATFAAAAAAYSDLRTPFGRGEALADLATATPRGGSAAGRVSLARRHGPGGRGSATEAAGQRAGAAAGWAGRIRQGRPARLALRVLTATAVCLLAVAAAGWQPASSALIVGTLTWVARSGRRDLAARPASAGWPAPARD
jgi:hypothetical protein